MTSPDRPAPAAPIDVGRTKDLLLTLADERDTTVRYFGPFGHSSEAELLRSLAAQLERMAEDAALLDWLDEYTRGRDAMPIIVDHWGRYGNWQSEIKTHRADVQERCWRAATLRDVLHAARSSSRTTESEP